MQTIYLLEDNPIISKVLDKHITKAGYTCIIFSRGDSFKDALEKETPDLMLCDIMVPGMTGLDIARFAKETPRLSPIPIIILTAMTDEKYRNEATEIGVTQYITKDNLVLAELVNDIAKHLAL